MSKSATETLEKGVELWTYFTSFSSVSTDDFEQVNVSGEEYQEIPSNPFHPSLPNLQTYLSMCYQLAWECDLDGSAAIWKSLSRTLSQSSIK